MWLKGRHILLVCAFVAYTTGLFWAYGVTAFTTMSASPYGITEDYATIKVDKHSPALDGEVPAILGEINEVIHDSGATLLFEGYHLPAVALYDPYGFLNPGGLVEGSYFTASNFECDAAPVALIKNGSAPFALGIGDFYVPSRPGTDY